MHAPALVTPAGAYDKTAVMRMALSQCYAWSTTAVQVGPSALDLEFRTGRVFERRMLSVALKAAWRADRLGRDGGGAGSRLGAAPVETLEAVRHARHQTEGAFARRQMAEIVNSFTPATPLAA